MTRTSNSLALQIAQLIEGHSEREVQMAVELLRSHGYGGSLLEYLGKVSRSERESAPSRGESRGKKDSVDRVSRSVLILENSDPEKFRMLSEFERQLRSGRLLETPEKLRRFGGYISKALPSRRSRDEMVVSLMSVLAEKPLEENRQLVEFANSLRSASSDDEFQRLAEFLIKGGGTSAP